MLAGWVGAGVGMLRQGVMETCYAHVRQRFPSPLGCAEKTLCVASRHVSRERGSVVLYIVPCGVHRAPDHLHRSVTSDTIWAVAETHTHGPRSSIVICAARQPASAPGSPPARRSHNSNGLEAHRGRMPCGT
eukprot:7390810-Prymnesium_polylepis.1